MQSALHIYFLWNNLFEFQQPDSQEHAVLTTLPEARSDSEGIEEERKLFRGRGLTSDPTRLLARVGSMFAWRTATVRLLEPTLGQSCVVGPVVAFGLMETQSSALHLRLLLCWVEVVPGVLHSSLDAAGCMEGSRKVM